MQCLHQVELEAGRRRRREMAAREIARQVAGKKQENSGRRMGRKARHVKG